MPGHESRAKPTILPVALRKPFEATGPFLVEVVVDQAIPTLYETD